MTFGRLAGALALMLAAEPGHAASLNAFSSFYVLGDSLSDNGNAYDATFGQIPKSPPYWNGRFSNGPVWSDRVSGAFDRRGIETGNFAFGGAKAKSDRDGIPDLKVQLGEYATVGQGDRGDRPLVALWAGGNDILNGSATRANGRAAATSVGQVARSLARAGVNDIMIFNLPDIGAVPSGNGSAQESRQNSRASLAFNREIARQIDNLRDDGVRVYSVDVYALFQQLQAHPRRFGVSNTTTPCLDDDDNRCTPRQERQRAFFDATHPSKAVHAAIAASARAALAGRANSATTAVALAPVMAATPTPIAPVPLPAPGLLLLAGLAALGVTSARAVRRPAPPRR